METIKISKVRTYTGNTPAGVATIALDDVIDMVDRALEREDIGCYAVYDVLNDLERYRDLTVSR